MSVETILPYFALRKEVLQLNQLFEEKDYVANSDLNYTMVRVYNREYFIHGYFDG